MSIYRIITVSSQGKDLNIEIGASINLHSLKSGFVLPVIKVGDHGAGNRFDFISVPKFIHKETPKSVVEDGIDQSLSKKVRKGLFASLKSQLDAQNNRIDTVRIGKTKSGQTKLNSM